MATKKRWQLGCFGLPVLLVGGCAGAVYVDQAMYNLPGAVLASTATPTRTLEAPVEVAQALDAYVQPRFEILRDRNFGQFRLVYRRHAGIVQLKVDSPKEKELIANVNAVKREYAISLLHCTNSPRRMAPEPGKAKLQVLYVNQQQIATEDTYNMGAGVLDRANGRRFGRDALEKEANKVLPRLMAGREYRTENTHWDVLMRPVLASKTACLSCHKGKRLGDTLGVMVYAVRKNRSPSAVASSPARGGRLL